MFRFILVAALIIMSLASTTAVSAERPNILWITSEDNSPYLGCYGDKQARTPYLDKLAEQGVRYRNAFSNAPVCSAARSTLITMMHASSLGIHNHRSVVLIPDQFKPYTSYFKNAGYYCTNHTKTDYNAKNIGKNTWDDTSNKAHYKNRKPGQPFFAVFNSTVSHEGQITDGGFEKRVKSGAFPKERIVTPEQVILPPYHPDTPAIREDWSRYYTNMFAMDKEMGELIQELDASGDADNTIVFYYSDHGGALARGKRNVHDSGTLVPLIIRFGKNFKHLAPADAGSWVEQPVGFVDFAVTAMSLCGIDIPKHVEGRPFLGEQIVAPRDHVFLFRGRMDERYDTAYAVRTEHYQYIRNFSPHRSYGQHYFYPFGVQNNMGSWWETFKAGKCNAVQSRYWLPKAPEELYDISKDPFEINNLADDPAFADTKNKLRTMLFSDLEQQKDTGFVPEGMWSSLIGDKTLYDYVQASAFPYNDILALADKATSRDSTQIPTLITAMSDAHPIKRYWGAQGCLVLGKAAAPAEAALRACLNDSSFSIRIAAAEAIAHLGDSAAALQSLEQTLTSKNSFEVLEAANALERGVADGVIPLEAAKAIFKRVKVGGNASRIEDYLLKQ